MSNLAVCEGSRRRGVGQLLVSECEAEVMRWGGEELWLEVSLDNAKAISFYQRLGYCFVEETSGREVVRRPFNFEVTTVPRGLMSKALRSAVTDVTLSPIGKPTKPQLVPLALC
uniref:N-acetyltransferase domain-containing protein n=1 Tax=Haptolina ericina TaxID=156174 RepID=A0A7S3BC36_9EUKA